MTVSNGLAAARRSLLLRPRDRWLNPAQSADRAELVSRRGAARAANDRHDRDCRWSSGSGRNEPALPWHAVASAKAGLGAVASAKAAQLLERDVHVDHRARQRRAAVLHVSEQFLLREDGEFRPQPR